MAERANKADISDVLPDPKNIIFECKINGYPIPFNMLADSIEEHIDYMADVRARRLLDGKITSVTQDQLDRIRCMLERVEAELRQEAGMEEWE